MTTRSGLSGHHRFKIGADSVAYVRHRGGLGGVIAPMGAAHQHGSVADGKEDFGSGGNERDHAAGRMGEANGVSGIVYHDQVAAVGTVLVHAASNTRPIQ
jgi:hypothetical protein